MVLRQIHPELKRLLFNNKSSVYLIFFYLTVFLLLDSGYVYIYELMINSLYFSIVI